MPLVRVTGRHYTRDGDGVLDALRVAFGRSGRQFIVSEPLLADLQRAFIVYLAEPDTRAARATLLQAVSTYFAKRRGGASFGEGDILTQLGQAYCDYLKYAMQPIAANESIA